MPSVISAETEKILIDLLQNRSQGRPKLSRIPAKKVLQNKSVEEGCRAHFRVMLEMSQGAP